CLGLAFLGHAPAYGPGDLHRAPDCAHLRGGHHWLYQHLRRGVGFAATSVEHGPGTCGRRRAGVSGEGGHAVGKTLSRLGGPDRHQCADAVPGFLDRTDVLCLRVGGVLLYSRVQVLSPTATLASSCQVSSESPSTAAAICATNSSARDAGAPVN